MLEQHIKQHSFKNVDKSRFDRKLQKVMGENTPVRKMFPPRRGAAAIAIILVLFRWKLFLLQKKRKDKLYKLKVRQSLKNDVVR